MNDAQKLYETFTKSTDPKIIMEAAQKIAKHFKWLWDQEPSDEIGEEFLFIIGAKQESFEWLILMMIHQINNSVGYHEYFSAIERRENSISSEQCNWGKIVIKEIQTQMTIPFKEYCTDLIKVFDRVIERSIKQEEENSLLSPSQENTISTKTERLPDYFLIVCDKQPKMKNKFIKSNIESLNYSLGKNTIIELSQYNNAQNLDKALPYAIAFVTSRFKERTLELDLDETKYSRFRSISSGIPIYGHSFSFISKIKDEKIKGEEKISFWRKIFSSNKPSINKEKIYNSIDNLGTVYTDYKKVDAAWQVQGMMFGQEQEFTLYYGSGYEKSKEITSKGHPFIAFTFDNENDAKTGLSSISFIKEASDTNEYISLEIIEFGYYLTDKGNNWVVVFWGENFSTEMYNEAKTKLKNAGGKMKGERIPTKKSLGQSNKKEKIKKEKVKYEKSYNQGSNTYEIHKAPSKSAALEFLKNKSVTKSLYYVIVETPEGNWGKDIDGIYQE